MIAQVKSSTASKRSVEERRECIISATRILISQHGFHGTGMAQIAKCSGVLVGQIYRDFASKEDLIAAIVARDIAKIMDDPDLPSTSSDDGADQLSRWVKRYIGRQMDLETRSIFADILSEATRNAKIGAIISCAHLKLRDCLAQAANAWSSAPEDEAARLSIADLIMACAGAMIHRQIGGLERDDALIEKMSKLIDIEISELRSSGR